MKLPKVQKRLTTGHSFLHFRDLFVYKLQVNCWWNRPLFPGSNLTLTVEKRWSNSLTHSLEEMEDFLPRTSARAHPYVFLSHDFGDIRTDMNAMIKAAMSDNMWNESATRAIELVRWPTTISTRKKLDVRKNIDTSRHFFPEYRPILSVLYVFFCCRYK